MKRLSFLVFLVASLLATVCHAGLSEGYAWLAAAQQSNGSVITSTTLVSPYASSAQSVLVYDRALSEYLLDRGEALQFVESSADASTDQLARALAVWRYSGPRADQLRQQLISRQNNDGGFGSYAGYDSNILDTAIALSALASHRSIFAGAISGAITYLQQSQASDGAFRLAPGDAQNALAMTAICAAALNRFVYEFPGVSDAAELAGTFLSSELYALQQSIPDWELALGLLAIIPVTTDSGLYAGLLSTLRQRQTEAGDWSADVFSTALAISVLQLVEGADIPEPSAQSIVRGRVIDAVTGYPLAGAEVLSVDSGLSVRADALGWFLLSDVTAGTANIQISTAGYFDQERSVETVSGEMLRLADILLQSRFDQVSIAGRVSDANTGKSVAGALIAQSGGLSVLADADGWYRTVSSPGLQTIDVSAESYMPQTVSIAPSMGESFVFSPALTPSTSAGQFNEAEITGRIVDAEYGTPIAGAIVWLEGMPRIADMDGRFAFDTQGGEFVVEIGASGYRTLTQRWLASAQGRSDVGDVALSLEPPATELLYALAGQITDAETGAPLPGATIEIAQSQDTYLSDAAGSFRADDIAYQEVDVRFAAPGYISERVHVRFEEPNVLDIDVRLASANIGGIIAQDFDVSRENYNAYERVDIFGTLKNTSSTVRSIRAYVQLVGPDGIVIAAPPLGGDSGSLSLEPILLAPEAEFSINTAWFTGISTPGAYFARLFVEDSNTGQRFVEMTAPFTIDNTLSLEQMAVRTSKSYAYQGRTEQMAVYLSLVNRSNVPVSLSIDAFMTTPDNVRNLLGTVPASILPSQTHPMISLDSFIFQPLLAGTYLFEAQTENFDIAPAQLTAAPEMRIEIRQSVSPALIAPGDGQRLKLEIELEGAGQ